MDRRTLIAGGAALAAAPLLVAAAGAPLRERLQRLRLAPDGLPRPEAPFGRGVLAARVLAGVIHGASWTGCRVPAPVAHALAGAGGTIEWAVRPAKRRRLARNLAHAIGRPEHDPAVRRLVLREVRNEAHRSADLLWALGDREAMRAATVIHGKENPVEALARGRGMILAGLHLGGWELAASIAEDAVPGAVTAVVADNWLAWAMEAKRRATGLRTVYRHEAALGAVRALREGGTVLLLGDDGWGDEPRTHRVRFLDGVASLPAGIVSLARLCQAPIVFFTFLPAGPRRWVGNMWPAIDPPGKRADDAEERRVLQVLADSWSAEIAAAPDQWAASFRIRWEGGP